MELFKAPLKTPMQKIQVCRQSKRFVKEAEEIEELL
jgi:hypothetical protein